MARGGRYSSSSSSRSLYRSRSRNRSRSKVIVRSKSRSRSRSTAGSRSRSRSTARSRHSSRFRSKSRSFTPLYSNSPYELMLSDFPEEIGDEDSESISEGVTFTKEEINKMTRVEIAQELDNAEEERKSFLADEQGGMKRRHAKECEELAKKQKEEVERLHNQLAKNKRKIDDLEKAMQSRLKFPRGPKVPECPVCLEEMIPPTEIFNCRNGHLVCGECKPKVTAGGDRMCITCRSGTYMGRATAVEQMIREMFDN